MQFIETSAVGVRSAVYRLVRDDNPVTFELLPMLHVASPQFYGSVRDRLDECDLILMEGVHSRSAAAFTAAYRLVERVRRSGLVSQSNALDLSSLCEKVEWADIPGDTFDRAWSQVPIHERLLVLLALPAVILAMCLAGPRRLLAQYLERDDLPSRMDALTAGVYALDSVVLDQRDRYLAARITSLVETADNVPRLVGIVWGAGHMPSITRLLIGTLHYRVASAEWLTAFEF